MKKILLFLLLLIPINVNALNPITIYLFHGDGCPHCANEQEYLETFLEANPNVKLVEYEVWYSSKNQELLGQVEAKFQELYGNQVQFSGVPITIIGDQYTIGFNDETKSFIENQVNEQTVGTYRDVISEVLTEEPVEDGGINPILFIFTGLILAASLFIVLKRKVKR